MKQSPRRNGWYSPKASSYTPVDNFNAFEKRKELIDAFMEYAMLIGDPVCSVNRDFATATVIDHIEVVLGMHSGAPYGHVLWHHYVTRKGMIPCKIVLINKTGVKIEAVTQRQLEQIMFDTYRNQIDGCRIFRAMNAYAL